MWKSQKDFELAEAVRNMDLDRVKTLVSEGADVNVRDIETEYLKGKQQYFVTMPLMIAVEAGDFDIVKFLIDKGADINVIWLFRGKTFLCTAISRRDKEVVELLLANGDDPNKKCLTKKTGKSIFTPLRLDNLLGYRDIAGLLTANGATEKPQQPGQALKSRSSITGKMINLDLKVGRQILITGRAIRSRNACNHSSTIKK